MNFLVTGRAQRKQVAFIVRAAVGDWQNMMYQVCRDKFSLSFAQLAQRIFPYVSVAYLLPLAAVAFFAVVTASKFVVVLLHWFIVVNAVAALIVRQLGATDKAARAFLFLWQKPHPLWATEKPSAAMRRRLV